MSRGISLRFALPILLTGVMLPLSANGQSQDQQSQTQSVAEAARKAKEQKKTPANSAPVITDDTLKPPTPEQKAAEATADAQAQANAASASANNAPAARPDSAAGPEDAEKKKQESAELAGLKKQLAAANKSLDLVQREFALDQETYLSNPDHDRDTAGKAKLDGIKQRISDKQQEVDVLKTRIAALQELVGSEAQANPPSPQQP